MASTTTTLDGYFKKRYGEKQDLVPKYAVVSDKVKFSKKDRQGESYNFPVKVRRGHGVTFNGGANIGTAFTLNAVKTGQFKAATLSGTEFVHRDSISYGAASRAVSAGEAAFGDAVDELYLDMAETGAFYRELMLLYGQDSIGEISATPDQSGTTHVYEISKASWAPGIWSQMEGAYVDVYDATLTTKRNTSNTIEITAIDADPTVRRLTFVGTEAEMDNIVATDVIVPRGAVDNWSAGIKKILTNTGTLFGIDAATYNLWKGNTYAAGGQLTMSKVQNAVCAAVARGLMEDIDFLLSPYAWNDLNNDHAALRRFAESTKAGLDLGTKSIEYYGVNGGVIRLTPHPMVKAGDMLGVPFGRLKRIGSTDLTFELPNESVKGEPTFFKMLADSAGFEMRCYWDQALIMTQPAKGVYVSGVTTATLGA